MNNNLNVEYEKQQHFGINKSTTVKFIDFCKLQIDTNIVKF